MRSQQRLFDLQLPEKPSKLEIIGRLAPLRGLLCDAVLSGFADWHKFMAPEGRWRVNACSQGSCIHDFIEHRVKEHLGEMPETVPCDRLNFFKLIISDSVVLRFKKITPEYLVVPPRTVQGRDWFRNLPIDGLSDHLLRINVGYLVNDEETEIIDIALTFQVSTRVLGWRHSILEPADVRHVYERYATGTPPQQYPLIPLDLKEEGVRKTS